jgi:predicted component of type VI protein secretion system
MREDFKNFVNNHKELITYVNQDKMTWQKFYDMYSLYGENSDVWEEYFKKEDSKLNISLKDIIDKVKGLDPDEVQKNINSLNKILSLVSTLISKDNNVQEEYEPMPLYKKFED